MEKKKDKDLSILARITCVSVHREHPTFFAPKTIEALMKKQIAAMTPGCGYIAGPAHNYLNVPL